MFEKGNVEKRKERRGKEGGEREGKKVKDRLFRLEEVNLPWFLLSSDGMRAYQSFRQRSEQILT